MANRLASATSPYLLQHAQNPLDWWPWGPEALAEAERRDVPIFLSIGYAACHWCHVMAHESFENEATAALLNEHFVSIKVDREERPDIDAIYMNATTALTGQGGWPMSAFLTPDGKPFFAGTYFPPIPSHGRPGFPQLIHAVATGWRDTREELVESAQHVVSELARLAGETEGSAGADSAPDLERAHRAIRAAFDDVRGGFGGAPKFPSTMVLDALLARGDEDSLAMVDRTLEAMIRGGIHDQLGGGFARYSVDAGWVIPHFEKMLYDNALLLGTLSRRWGRRQNPEYARIVGLLVGWLAREMRTPAGAFAASLDADSLDDRGQSREGAFYVWTPEQLIDVLGAADAEVAARAYTVTEGGTFEDGQSTLQAIAGVDPDTLEDIRLQLLAARELRPRPARDDKVVAAWNGWLIDALATAAMVFDEPDWLVLATTAAQHLWSVHWIDGRLRRTSRDGIVGTATGVLEDYAALALGMIRLGAATADPVWLDRSRALLGVIDEVFIADDGGWHDTPADGEQLFARPRDFTDSVTPSGTSTAITALRLLARLTGETGLDQRATQARESAAGLIARAPRFSGWLLADLWSEAAAAEIAVVDSPDLVRLTWQLAPAGSVVVAGASDQPGIPLLEGRTAPGAYVCRDFICRRPVTTAEELRQELS